MFAQVKEISILIQKVKNIIVLTGAGISTSAGIPDFRSPKTGLYFNLQKYHLPYPEAIFDIDFFKENPKPFYALAKELLGKNYRPTTTHRFIRLLEEEGKLLRNYTQNIDGLERTANIHKIIECHGSFQTATCLVCGKKYDLSFLEIQIKNDRIPLCNCSPESIIKPDIVFYGEALPSIFFESVPLDFPKADLLLVIGTSLNVYPVAWLIDEVNPRCPVILINKTPPPFNHQKNIHLLLGDCDEICSEISKESFKRLP